MSKLEDRFLEQLDRMRLTPVTREHVFHPPRRFRFDFAWTDLMVAIEVDGGEWVQGRHNRGAEMAKAAEKRALANLDGWTVYTVTGKMVRDGRAASIAYRAVRHATLERAKVTPLRPDHDPNPEAQP